MTNEKNARKRNSRQMSAQRHEAVRNMFVRKHFTMMSDEELDVLYAKLSSCVIDDVIVAEHLIKRKHDYSVHFTIDEMLSVIHTGVIIDYSRDRRNRKIERFLIREMTGDQHRLIVLQHKFGEWVALTVWINESTDMHETLDKSIYTDFNIMDCID